MDIFNSLLGGFAMMLNPTALLWIVVGSFIGTFVGALPGLGPSAGVAILLPVSFALQPAEGLSLLIAIYLGCTYGGRITSILLNVPGDPAAVVTCFDGFPLMKQGKGGKALGCTGISSFVGGMIGIIIMTFFTPLLANVALAFGPPELFSVMVFALIAVNMATDNSSKKGMIMLFFGLVLATVGADYLTGRMRLVFGIPKLMDGIQFVNAAVGLFGLAEVFIGMEQTLKERLLSVKGDVGNLFPTWAELKSITKATLIGTSVGCTVGMLPGSGCTVCTFVAYGACKKASKHPEMFGKGSLEGVSGPEAADNASVAASMIPMLALGIPTSATAAMIMGGFIMHDLQPGPMMFIKSADVAWAIIAGLYICNFILLFINMGMVPLFVGMIRAAQPILYPTVAVLCIIGIYSINNSMFDVIVTMVFGVIGYFAKKGRFPVAGLLLALILGPNLEATFRQTAIMARGDYTIFLTRPIAMVFLILTVLTFVYPIISNKIFKTKAEKSC